MEYSAHESGKRLSALRQQPPKKQTQEDIAERFGVSTQAVSRWERGEVNIPIDVAFDLADTYHVTLDFLYGRSDKKNPQAEDVTEYTGISPQAAKVLHDLPEAFGADTVEILNSLILSDGFSAMLLRLAYLRKRAEKLSQSDFLPQKEQIRQAMQLQKKVDADCGFGVVITGVNALHIEAESIVRAVRQWISAACGISDAEFTIAEKSRAAHAEKMKQERRRKGGR